MIKVLKTYEICDDLWQQIVDGFNESFEGHHTTVESFKNGFCTRNQLGYGYHAIDFDDESGEIRGFNTYSPTLYKNNLKVFVSGSTYVRKKYRKDIFIFMNMVKALREQGKEDGFFVNVGVPNKNSVNYALKFMKATLVGYLDYYILPLRISRCVKQSYLRPFDFFSKLFCQLFIKSQVLTSKLFNSMEEEVKYSLIVDDAFFRARFNSPIYHKYDDGYYRAYYHIVDEKGVQVAYLLDFREKDKRTKLSLAKAIQYIILSEKVDAVLFVGYLRLKQNILFKVPKRFVPKPLPLTYTVFDKSKKEEFSDMSDVNNWNFSLMNFDVR